MTDRVKDDPTIEDPGDQRFLERPVIIVEAMENGSQRYIVCPEEIDPEMNQPQIFGIVLSDLVDHIASTYRSLAGQDEEELRKAILKVMRDEDRLKDADPSRGQPRGAAVTPKKN